MRVFARGRLRVIEDFRCHLVFPILAIAALLVWESVALGQEPTDIPSEPVPAQTPPAAGPTVPLPGEGPNLHLLQDRAFDRAGYQVGPGDALAITSTGSVTLQYELMVTPEGRLLIPGVGVVNVLGLNLEEAEDVVEARVRRIYRDVDVHLTLRGLRSFKVFVVGAVPDPGPRAASAATRVSELLADELAADPREGASNMMTPEPVRISQRNVQLIRANGDTLQVDIVRFRQTGDLTYNPTLESGDLILVPGLDETVRVEGRVFFPGTYEYREGESLAELLSVANGYRGFRSDAHDVLRVSRFVGEQERRFYAFTQSEAMGEPGRSFEMEPFDAVFVPSISHFKEQLTATIEGEVTNPGVYPIFPDSTTVRDLVELAGGFTEEASLVQARITRSRQGEAVSLAVSDSLVPVELLTEDEKRILEVRRRGGEGNVVIDFEALFLQGEDVYNLALQNGDNISIPKRRRDITVLGAVREPGIVPFDPNRRIDHYVDLAGGYTDRADEGDVAVIKSKLQVMLDRDEAVSLESGDTIVVPYKVKRDWLQIYQTTTSFVTSLTSLVLFFIAATQ